MTTSTEAIEVIATADTVRAIGTIPASKSPAFSIKHTNTEQENIFPMYHGKAVDSLAGVSGKGAVINKLTDRATITKEGLQVVIKGISDLQGTLGVNTHKLLCMCIVNFTALNNYSNNKKDQRQPNLNVQIPLEEYAFSLGYPVKIKPTKTLEEAEAEKKRADNALKDAKKKIRKDLDMLRNIELTWEENKRGGDFSSLSFIGSREIKNGYIKATIDAKMAEYLLMLPITQYPRTLLGVDGRNSNAYVMGYRMIEHYNIDNNQIRGTATRLKVDTLLGYTNLPPIEEVRSQRKTWTERIKEPFENALDELTKKGVLADWSYRKAGGIELTDEQAIPTNYEDWKDMFVEFTIKDTVDHTARLARRAEEKKEIQKRRTRKKK